MYRSVQAQCFRCGASGELAALRLDANGSGQVCWKCEVALQVESHQLNAAPPRRPGMTLVWAFLATIGVVAVGAIAFFYWLMSTIWR